MRPARSLSAADRGRRALQPCGASAGLPGAGVSHPPRVPGRLRPRRSSARRRRRQASVASIRRAGGGETDDPPRPPPAGRKDASSRSARRSPGRRRGRARTGSPTAPSRDRAGASPGGRAAESPPMAGLSSETMSQTISVTPCEKRSASADVVAQAGRAAPNGPGWRGAARPAGASADRSSGTPRTKAGRPPAPGMQRPAS